jgi:hypothetical protein
VFEDPDLVAERQSKLDALGPRPPWWRWLTRRRWKQAYRRIWAADVSYVGAMLRRVYSKEFVTEMANKTHPAIALIGKFDGDPFDGGQMKYTIVRKEQK